MIDLEASTSSQNKAGSSKPALFPFIGQPASLPFHPLNFDQLNENLESLSSGLDDDKDRKPIRPIKQLKRTKIVPSLSLPVLSTHKLNSYTEAPKESLSNQETFVENNQQNDPILIQEQLSECFEFTIQGQLATLFYNLEKVTPVVEWYTLTELNLSRQNLTSLNNLNKYFSFLEHLQISHNQLRTLANLPNSLIYLYAGDNKILDLDIYQLEKLQHLDVAHNNIQVFEDMSRLKSLRIIDASHNSITSCLCFQNLPGLTKLSLKGNCIRRLNHFESITKENQIETLDVSFNRIECLDSLEKLTELRTLNADHNDIKYIKLNQPLEKLFKLQLSFNRLRFFDASPFPEIRTLYLDDNNIQSLIGVVYMPRIESLSLRDQGGHQIEYNLQNLRGIRKLYLSGSPFTSIRQLIDFYSLEYLELCAADLDKLPDNFNKQVPNLSTLYLSVNRLDNIRPLRKLKYLKRLVLIDNQLTSTNEVISVVQCLKQLQYLDLRQNPICANMYRHIDLMQNKDRISPYITSALDDTWEAEDDDFCLHLLPVWSERRSVYRALIIQNCPKLVELDHLKITQNDRLQSTPIIENYKKKCRTNPTTNPL